MTDEGMRIKVQKEVLETMVERAIARVVTERARDRERLKSLRIEEDNHDIAKINRRLNVRILTFLFRLCGKQFCPPIPYAIVQRRRHEYDLWSHVLADERMILHQLRAVCALTPELQNIELSRLEAHVVYNWSKE